MKVFEARVEEVHSGDDFILLVNIGIDGLFKRTRVRLNGVDVPNAYKAKPDTEAGRVRDEVKKMLTGTCIIEVVSEGKGGWIVNMSVVAEGGKSISINSFLRNKGYVYSPKKGQE